MSSSSGLFEVCYNSLLKLSEIIFPGFSLAFLLTLIISLAIAELSSRQVYVCCDCSRKQISASRYLLFTDKPHKHIVNTPQFPMFVKCSSIGKS